MKRVELGIVLGTNYGLGRVAQYVGQKVRPRGSGEKRAEDELPSWRSMRSLTVKLPWVCGAGVSPERAEPRHDRGLRGRGCQGESKGAICAKEAAGMGKGAGLKTRHYKSVKERRRERKEGGLKSVAEAGHTPLTE